MSLSKQMAAAVLLLVTMGALGGGMVLLAQGTTAKGPTGVRARISAASAAQETDLSLFREGGKRFFAEDYRLADRSFSRLLENFPESPLAPQAAQLAGIAREMSTTDAEASVPLTRAVMARQIIDAVLAGARAAESAEGRAGHGKERFSDAAGKRKANELLRQYSALYKEGKYQEAESCAAKALELDPDNAAAAAAWEIAHEQSRKAEFECFIKGHKEVSGSGLPWTTRRAATPDVSRPISGSVKADQEAQIVRALRRPVTLSFNDTPLSQVIADLRAAHGLNILIDRAALERDGIAPSRTVTLRLEEVSLKTALKLLLEGVSLTYVVRDGAIVVTTPTAARGNLVRRIYKVEKLLGRDATREALIRLITRTVEPATWEQMGGAGCIEYYSLTRALVVVQSPDVQEQVQSLLRELLELGPARDEQ
jgi:tetratricopeptide (TPR) repeat protein